jgi:putative FmdB family regulatory protein
MIDSHVHLDADQYPDLSGASKRARHIPSLVKSARAAVTIPSNMPIYEYRCEKCRRITSVLTTRVSEKVDAVCTHCGGKKMSRLMSRFAMPRSEESRMESLSDPSRMGDIDEDDPKSVARMMKRMGKEMGDEFNGPEFDEAVEELESGGDLDDDGPGDDDL